MAGFSRQFSAYSTVDHPNPGATVYTVAWDNPSFADVDDIGNSFSNFVVSN